MKKPTEIIQERQESNNIRHRFYEDKFPQVDDCVVVQVSNIQENASYVELLEYNHIAGMIPPNEATQSMRQTMQQALKVGKQEVVKVLRVDEEKGYIDLSKVKVSSNEEGKALEKFHKSKTIHSILNNIAQSKVITVEEGYEKIIWPLYQLSDFSHAFDALRAYLHDKQILEELKLTDKVLEVLDAEIKRRMTPQSLKIVANFKLNCNDFDGIQAIKASLRAGQEKSRANFALTFRILGSPIYEGIVETSDRVTGIEVMKEGLKAIEETIKKLNGTYSLCDTIQVYGDKSHENQNKQDEDKDDSDDDDDDDEDEDIEGMGESEESEDEEKGQEKDQKQK